MFYIISKEYFKEIEKYISVDKHISLFENVKYLLAEVNKTSDGSIIGIIRIKFGRKFVKEISMDGLLTINTLIEIKYDNMFERDMLVLKLLKQKFTQERVAIYLGISQSTVSNITKKYNKK